MSLECCFAECQFECLCRMPLEYCSAAMPNANANANAYAECCLNAALLLCRMPMQMPLRMPLCRYVECQTDYYSNKSKVWVLPALIFGGAITQTFDLLL